jgi:lipoyl(octanoyl) transferase
VIPYIVRDFGRRDYTEVWESMRSFTDARDTNTTDEIWFVEHPPVFTLGLNGDRAHVLEPADVPIVATDRGGQVTYHGPGQLVAYVLLDLKRLGLGIRPLVELLELSVIDVLASYGVAGRSRRDAPGVYVGDRKLAALGLRIRRGCSYHGVAINVNMDLSPFARINPCGMRGLEVTQIADLCAVDSLPEVRRDFEHMLGSRIRAYLPPVALSKP